jgi:hypothetical protein
MKARATNNASRRSDFVVNVPGRAVKANCRQRSHGAHPDGHDSPTAAASKRPVVPSTCCNLTPMQLRLRTGVDTKARRVPTVDGPSTRYKTASCQMRMALRLRLQARIQIRCTPGVIDWSAPFRRCAQDGVSPILHQPSFSLRMRYARNRVREPDGDERTARAHGRTQRGSLQAY